MKNYKYIAFNLLILFIFSILIISCQQEVLTDTGLPTEYLLETDESSVGSEIYAMPKGLENESSEYMIAYVDNLSDDELEKLKENHRIQTFLEIEGVYTSVYNQLKEGDLFTDIDIGEHLTPQQLNRLVDFSVSDAISARCGGYPVYNCHNPEWCGSKNYHSHCGSSAAHTWCGGATYRVDIQYCGYPHGVLVRWWFCTSYICSS